MMKANKVTVTIVVECLHVDAVRAIVSNVLERIHEDDKHEGKLVSDDGDTVEWKTTLTPVEF